MEPFYEEMKEHLRIKFNADDANHLRGDSVSQIDANTFVNYIIHLTTIIQEVNKELSPDRKINVKINALSKGSFLVDIELQSFLESIRQLIFTPSGRSDLVNIIEIVGVLIAVKKFLGGKKPASTDVKGDNVVINNGDVTMTVNINVYNIYKNNPVVSEAIEKQFETLESDENIENVVLLDDRDKEIIKVDRTSFGSLATPNEMIENPILENIESSTTLNIIRLSFDPKLKSDFFLKGSKITAYIKDKAFYSKIDNGEAFAKGDILRVELKVLKQFDDSVNTNVIKGYEIVNVIEHIPRSNDGQLRMGFK